MSQHSSHTYSNWIEASFAIAAILKGQNNIVPTFLVGTIAINQLFTLGVCFVHGGHQDRTRKYQMSMAIVYARMLPGGFALALSPTAFDVGIQGESAYLPAAPTR
jgi:Ca2+/H+ antiporter